jgi:hypothetical protein
MSVRPYAEAFEARFRQIEDVLSVDPPPHGVRRMIWDRTWGLRRRFPALQDALASTSPFPQVALDRSDVEAMRVGRVALPCGGPDALPEGLEPLGGARFAGYVEQSLGGSVDVLFQRWCLERARSAAPVGSAPSAQVVADSADARFADPEELKRFCRDLVDKALGIGPEEHPDAAHGFVWHPETVVFGPEHLAAFAEGAARAMFAAAWSHESCSNPTGADPSGDAPATPPDALLEGYRLAGRCEAANLMPIDDIVEAARIADGGEGVAEPEEFGRCYALSACGHGASWFDRHADFDLKPVSFEYAGPAVGHETSVDHAYAPRI